MLQPLKKKHDACIKLGAEKAINYKQEDFYNEVMKYTANNGVDVIIDFIGGPYLQKNINCLKMDGRLIMLSLLSGSKVSELDIRNMVRKRLSIIGSALRSRSLDYRINLV
ncbi:MAG: zinc-binding dehydrogenase, partial [Bacteroidetes bacterium]|nr:zinc-binding dehydrogenase [Bacteroidota bacterium]